MHAAPSIARRFSAVLTLRRFSALCAPQRRRLVHYINKFTRIKPSVTRRRHSHHHHPRSRWWRIGGSFLTARTLRLINDRTIMRHQSLPFKLFLCAASACKYAMRAIPWRRFFSEASAKNVKLRKREIMQIRAQKINELQFCI